VLIQDGDKNYPGLSGAVSQEDFTFLIVNRVLLLLHLGFLSFGSY
jgi:hypothetical protein